MKEKVGELSAEVISALHISLDAGQPIFLGPSNIEHMRSKHLADYEKYGKYLPDILNKPDYVGENQKDGSIEYVKEFVIDGEYVKVAVRISGGGQLYARSLYCLNPKRVENFIRKGTLKKI